MIPLLGPQITQSKRHLSPIKYPYFLPLGERERPGYGTTDTGIEQHRTTITHSNLNQPKLNPRFHRLIKVSTPHMSSTILSALVIAPLAYLVGGFVAQHTETVQKTEVHPIYTSRGMEIAWNQGFTSEELTEIFVLIACFCVVSYFAVSRLTGISMKSLCIVSIVFGVFFATFTETTLVEEVRYDAVEHMEISSFVFSLFWIPFLLKECCLKSNTSARPHIE